MIRIFSPNGGFYIFPLKSERGSRPSKNKAFQFHSLYFYTIISVYFFMQSVVFAQTAFSAAGITEPIKDETLSASVSGRITKINFKEGDSVKKDDVIIELHKTMEELEVERRKLVWESKIEVRSAEARQAMAKSDFEGTKRLFESTQSVSKEELDTKELEYKLAGAELEALGLAEQREKIEYEMALEQLRRRQIVSPINGIITRFHLQEGEFCDANQPLVDVVDTTECYFISHIEVKSAPPFTLGQRVELRIEASQSAVSCEGRISFISPVVDPASGLQEIKAVFDNSDGKINPGVAGEMILNQTDK